MSNLAAVLLSLSALAWNGGIGSFTHDCEPGEKVAIAGTVHGGQAPVALAHVHVFAAGHSRYGAASHSLLRDSGREDLLGEYVLANNVGEFKIAARQLHCEAGDMLYVLATGGNAGVGFNEATGLMAAVGPCPAADKAASVWVNEVSTVATAYALAAYAADATHISSSPSKLARSGMANSFALAANLYDGASGKALATTPAGNGEAPQATIDTLANVLAACVNTPHAGSPACKTLFQAAEVKDDDHRGWGWGRCERREHDVADTATAAIEIAHHSSVNVAALFALQAEGGMAFQPALESAPTSFVLAVAYTGGGMDVPLGIAVDGAGNVWAGNRDSGTISAFSPLGVPLAANGYDSGAQGTAYTLKIDAAGNVWTGNEVERAVHEITSAGVQVPLPGFAAVPWQKPLGMAFNQQGQVWVGDDTGLTQLTSAGQVLNKVAEPSSEGDGVADVEIDAQGNVWATNFDNNLLVKLSGAGVPYFGDGLSGAMNEPEGIAIDSQNNVWVSNLGGASLSKFASDGTLLSGGGFTGGGLGGNRFLAVDGADHVWTASNSHGMVSEFDAAGAPVAQSGYVVKPGGTGFWGVAVDGSGNVWMSSGDGSLVQLVGAAAPVVTPMVTAATTGQIGVRP